MKYDQVDSLAGFYVNTDGKVGEFSRLKSTGTSGSEKQEKTLEKHIRHLNKSSTVFCSAR